jgi:hypothetical protein
LLIKKALSPHLQTEQGKAGAEIALSSMATQRPRRCIKTLWNGGKSGRIDPRQILMSSKNRCKMLQNRVWVTHEISTSRVDHREGK